MTARAEIEPLQSSAVAGKIDPARLAEANINPRTGLATDYLNHFNEAIMVLEMVTAMPECVEDFLAWRTLSYQDHFAASHFKGRDLAIAAYEQADPTARQSLDTVADTMNTILTATREALQTGLTADAAGALAQQATMWLKPLVARAGAIINGQFVYQSCDTATEAPQLAVDRLLENQTP
jgi:hypothetical protein